ncbi:glycosyltransferase family 1 protein [Variovorax sp. OV329]|uniref:glycosyltransferase family 4 protein n=1 Tax=Variovorax sp. OV329 TaxID=1882825 RepID=UPI0008E19697|nr:glycosyltransferase family 1 protein [Variovorax sp. OV329]SFL86760.1 Glycosyltransferase involved in cell wall bisynthesis [Variovorax sp. OV329]
MSTTLAPIVVDHMPPARRSLRIALVTETYPPEVNGVALTLQRVVEGLRDLQHDIQLVRPRQAEGDLARRVDRLDEVLMRGVPIPRYPEMKMGMPANKALGQLWSRHRPDLVYIATEGPLGWSALQIAHKLRLPVCSDFRTNFHAYSKHYGIGWLYRPIMGYLRKFHNRTAFTMVPSESLRQQLRANGFERLVLVTRGVDTELFSPARRSEALRQSWGATPETPVALFVGRLAAEKNLGALANAFNAMRAQRADTKLVVVGEGPAAQQLASSVPDAIFAGTRRGEELGSYYASADLFVFPSMTETFGNVTLEAMASGLAVLAYDHASAGQMIRSGENGLIAPLADEAEYVRLAHHLVASPAHARQMGLRARETAGDAGWDRIVAQVEEVLLATLASGKATQAVDARGRPMAGVA